MAKQNRVVEMKRLRERKKMTLQEIGNEFGISRERVRQLIGNTGHTGRVDALRGDADALRDWLYYDETMTVPWIADKYRVSESTVRKILGPRWKYLLSIGMRRCYRCHEIKPIDEFGVANKRYKQMKVSGVCKECNNDGAKYYYQLKKSKQAGVAG